MATIDRSGNHHHDKGTPDGGRFAPKGNSAPVKDLEGETWARSLSNRELVDAARAELEGVASTTPNGKLPQSDERIQLLAVLSDRLERAEERDDQRNRFVDLNDVPTMGGDELESLADWQIVHAHSQAMVSADRLQEHVSRRQATPISGSEHLEVVDFRHVTEKNVTDVLRAARTQLGGVGVYRTDVDLAEQIVEEADGELDDAQVEKVAVLWREKFEQQYEEDTTNAEIEVWQRTVGAAVREHEEQNK